MTRSLGLLAAAGPARATLAPPKAAPVAQVTLPITQARPGTSRAQFSSLPESEEPPYPVEGLLPIAKSMVLAPCSSEFPCTARLPD